MHRRMSRVAGLAMALVVTTGAHAAQAQPAPITKYSLANGCWTIQPADAGVAPRDAQALRLKATALGRYMLFTKNTRYLAADGTAVAPATAPGPAADWGVQDAPDGAFTLSPASDPDRLLVASADGGLRTAARADAGDAARLRFVPAEGCATFPELELNATGTPARGNVPFGAVKGLIDGHMHWMTYQYFGGDFHCGRPWSRYGVTAALPDCSDIEGPQGSAAVLQNTLSYGTPVKPHSTVGYPTFGAWSRDNLTYEGTYWRWVQRAWMAGERVMVMGITDNRILCEEMARRHLSCDEMDSVRRGMKAIRELQEYVDAQAGGPGRGFFQIVEDPYAARRVINSGRMAVILEMEISEPYGCHDVQNPTCDVAQIDKQMDELEKIGVRSAFLLNKYDNPLTGVRFDEGAAGLVVNSGNRQSAGRFWDAGPCAGKEADNSIPTLAQGGAALSALGIPGGTLPVYGPPPHCNTRGLSALGAHVVRRMMDKGWIVNADHMSQAAVDQTLTIAESRDYSGVMSPHSWMDPGNWPRIWALGGMAFPQAAGATRFVERYKQLRPKSTPYLFGWGFGADLGGLAHQGGPVPQGSPAKVTYPFRSYDGSVQFERQRSGERTFDYSKEGIAHYGMYADWLEEVRKLGSGTAITDDMLQGAEAYLQMWERASGVPHLACRDSRIRLTSRGLGSVRLGATPESTLRAAGQPATRTRTWTWCARGKANAHRGLAAVFRGDRVGLVATTAHAHSAGGVRPGQPAAVLAGRARSVGGGIYVRRAGSASAWVYRVRGGQVQAVGVADGALAKGGRPLRAAFAAVPVRFATVTPPDAARTLVHRIAEQSAQPLAVRDANSSSAKVVLLVCKLGAHSVLG